MEAKSPPPVVYNWVDIKDDFWKSSENLKLGELVHDNLFGLFEAMSAIEIMDPKMDAGMICNRKRQVLQFPEAIEAGKVKIKEFTEVETLGILDELTACFVTWLDGQSLVQSIFICMYCHNPYIIEDTVLKATCIAMLKMVDIIRNFCTKAKVFEEEDFQPMTYSFKLASDVTQLRVIGMLQEADGELSKKLKIEVCKALKKRLRFWHCFYTVLLAFEKPDVLESTKCKDSLALALNILRVIKPTLPLGLQADHKKDYYMPGFDPLINQRLLPPSFPRQAEIFQRDKAIEYLQGLIERLQNICLVVECHTLHMILEFLCEFSKKVPCVLSRTLLQLLICQPNHKILGRRPLLDMTRDAIKIFNGTPSVADLSPLTSPEAKAIANEFVLKAAKAMSELIEAYGHNRARQRERLSSLLSDLGTLQAEADKADQLLHKMLQNQGSKRQHLACFESWVLYHSLSIMIQHIFLGFELDLFNPHEFHYVYWYLEYLFGWANNCLHLAEMLLTTQEQHIEKKFSKKEKRRKKEILQACSEQIREHKSLRVIFDGMKDICMGNIKAYEGFNKDGKIKHPEVFFDNERMRFEHRFRSFTAVDTHQGNDYHTYKETTREQQFTTSTTLYEQSMNHFQKAMENLQYVEKLDDEGESLMTVAKKNFIIMKIAASGRDVNQNQKYAEWDFSIHPTYPVIKFT